MRSSSTMWHHCSWTCTGCTCLNRIQYKLCVLVHRCLNGAAPQYLSELIQPQSDVDSRRRLRSASTAEVLVPAMRRSTIGDCAFSVAGPRAWNNLPINLRQSRHLLLSKHLEVTSVQLQFHCIIDQFLYRALEAASAAYASLNMSLMIITLCYITCPKRMRSPGIKWRRRRYSNTPSQRKGHIASSFATDPEGAPLHPVFATDVSMYTQNVRPVVTKFGVVTHMEHRPVFSDSHTHSKRVGTHHFQFFGLSMYAHTLWHKATKLGMVSHLPDAAKSNLLKLFAVFSATTFFCVKF